jgi:hypothetical protein
MTLFTRCTKEHHTIFGIVNMTVEATTVHKNTTITAMVVAESDAISVPPRSKLPASILAGGVSCGFKAWLSTITEDGAVEW